MHTWRHARTQARRELQKQEQCTHDENRKQEQSENSGERKLLRGCPDVFRSVGTEGQSAVLDRGSVQIQVTPVPSPAPPSGLHQSTDQEEPPWRSACS